MEADIRKHEPKVVFLDTQVFVQLNFQYDRGLLEAFRQHVRAGRLRHVSTEVTVSEVRAKIASAVGTATVALQRFRTDARILRNAESPILGRVFKGLSRRRLTKDLNEQWTEFLKDLETTVIPTDSINPSVVFERYFRNRPPFNNPKKKSEFPDGFALELIRSFARENQCRVTVVSGDPDWEAVVEEDPNLELATGLSKLLQGPQKDSPLFAQANEVLAAVDDEINEATAQECLGLGFFPVDRPVTVVGVEVSNVSVQNAHVVNVTRDAILFSADAWVGFDVAVEYPKVQFTNEPHPWDVGFHRQQVLRAELEQPSWWASHSCHVLGTIAWDPTTENVRELREVTIVDPRPVLVYLDEYES